MEISCEHCGRIFHSSPRHKRQRYCSQRACQRARKTAWQCSKMRTDADYRANQRASQRNWMANHPDYWQGYRKRHPQYVERNCILQWIRNRKRQRDGNAKLDSCGLIAKMDVSERKQLRVVGQFYLVPLIAKMDALKVNIIAISDS